MKFHPDFKEFLELLNKNKIKYLVIGGYAVNFHGYVRATGDIDIWVERNNDNAGRVLRTLQDFGLGESNISKQDLLKKNKTIQLGRVPYRIDILTSPDGVDFEDCYRTKITEVIDGIAVNFIDRNNLIKNKRASGRPADLGDIDNLKL